MESLPQNVKVLNAIGKGLKRQIICIFYHNKKMKMIMTTM